MDMIPKLACPVKMFPQVDKLVDPKYNGFSVNCQQLTVHSAQLTAISTQSVEII